MKITKLFYLVIASILFLSCRQGNTLNTDLPNTTVQENTNSNTSNQTNTKDYQFTGEVHGCGNFIVFRTTQDNTKAIKLRVNKESLKLSDNPQTFEIEKNNSLEVYIEDFGKDDYKNRVGYCFDRIAVGRSEPIRFPAIKGKVTIYTSEDSDGYFYNVTVLLENITFQTSDKTLLKVEKVEMKDAKVGWLPGQEMRQICMLKFSL